MHIGVFGGSFDPVHVGHVTVARAVLDLLGLDELRVVPAWRQPLKGDNHRATASDRLAMLRMAFAGIDRCVIDECEIERGGISYTIDTLRDLSSRFPGDKLSLIVGADTASEFENWRDHSAIMGLVDLVVVSRPGEVPVIPGLHSVVPVPPVDVSASEIRGRLESGQSVDGMVPQDVLDYIEHRRLYGVGA